MLHEGVCMQQETCEALHSFFFLQVLFVWGTDGDVDLLRQCTYACRLAYRCQSNEKVLMIWKYLKTQSFCICGGWQNLSALTDDTTAGSIIVFDIHGDWLVMSSSRLKFFGPWPYRGILFPSILFLFLPKTNMKSRGWKILGRFRDRCYLFTGKAWNHVMVGDNQWSPCMNRESQKTCSWQCAFSFSLHIFSRDIFSETTRTRKEWKHLWKAF